MSRRQELLSVPKRKWSETLTDVRGVYVIPSRRKHDSGWACMDFVAEVGEEKTLIGFGGYCDAVYFQGEHFNMDCEYPSGIIHIWNRNNMIIESDLSSIDFVEIGGEYYNRWYKGKPPTIENGFYNALERLCTEGAEE